VTAVTCSPKQAVAAVASHQAAAWAMIQAVEASGLANGPIDPETSTAMPTFRGGEGTCRWTVRSHGSAVGRGPAARLGVGGQRGADP
jgi:hypothetical protein